MPRQSKKITLVGGRNADKVNPHGLIKQWKAICVPDHEILSPQWRNSKAEAQQDAADHIRLGHYIEYNVRITDN